MVIAFYISGHGFGHASRDIEVINALAARRPGLRIVVRTTVPPWFFDLGVRAPIDLQPAEVDCGIVQIDSLHLDEDETARRAARFYADFDRRAADEAAWLRTVHATAVIGDMPPLAFAAAECAGLPSIALGNFTWDWIYTYYPQFETLAPGVLAVIRRAYAGTTRALRLPLHGGFGPMAGRVQDIPLIARRSRRGRQDSRRALGIAGQIPVILLSFGAYGARLPYGRLARQLPFSLIVTDHEVLEASTTSRLMRITSEEMTALDLRYEDLVAASDLVVTKPGYGIVSECIANHAALLYTSRGRFAEYDLFVSEMPRLLRCRHISQEDLAAGRWEDSVAALLAQPKPPVEVQINGAEVAADEILQLAGFSDAGAPLR